MIRSTSMSQRLLGWGAQLPESVRLVLIASVVMSIGVFIPIPLLRAVLVLPVALLAPGYAITLVAFDRPHLDTPVLLALCALLSMAFYPLLALLLTVLLISYSPITILAGTDLVFALLLSAVVRRERLSAREPLPAVAPSLWSGTRGMARFATIVVLVILALAIESRALPTTTPAPFTEFYLAGRWAHLNTIAVAGSNDTLSIDLGLTNRTHDPQTYRITPVLDGNRAWQSRQIRVDDGKSWAGTIGGTVPAQGCLHHLVITLYKGTDSTALSELSLWLRGSGVLPANCPAGQGAANTP